MGGEMELEFVDTDKDGENPHRRMQLDKFSLKPAVTFAEHVSLKGLIIFKIDKAYCSEVYGIFSGLPLNSCLKIGLDDRFLDENPSRKTEAITLTETSFFRYDEFAVTWSGKLGIFYWNASVSNGFVLGASAPCEDKGYPIIADKKQTTKVSSDMEVGGEIGLAGTAGKLHTFDIHLFGFRTRLSSDDVVFLQGIQGYGISDNRRNYMLGGALEYGFHGLGVAAAAIKAQDGILGRLTGFAQLSYRIPLLHGRYLTSTEPLVRFGWLDNDLANLPADPLTWDRQLITLALITTITKGVCIKSEYYITREKTGGAAPDNNEVLVQLEMKF